MLVEIAFWRSLFVCKLSITIRFRFRFRLILFCQHTTFSNSNVYTNNEIIKNADMEAPIKTSYGRYHRATRKIN